MRPSKDSTFLAIATQLAAQATCARRRVGCVITNSRNQILSTGFNGVPPDWPHCTDKKCPGADLPSGTGLDICEANHAEINALIQCEKPWEIETVYCTASPCITCVKAILCTSARRIVFLEKYPHKEAEELWVRFPWIPSQVSREWVHHRGYAGNDVVTSSGLHHP